MKVRLFCCCGLFLFGLFLINTATYASIKSIDITDVNIPKVKIINKIYYITLDAKTPFGRGYQQGAALKFVIHKGIAQWKEWIKNTLQQPNPDVEIAEFIHDTNYLTGIKKYTPLLYQELQGIAKGSEVDINTLYAYQMFDEFVLYVSKKYRLQHCSGFGVYGRKNRPNLLGQNNDLPPYYDGTHTVLNIKYPNKRAAIIFTWAGILAQNGVNNRNVGVTMNIVPTSTGRKDGVPMPYIIRKILEKSSVNEALAFLKSLKGAAAAPMNYIIGDATKVVTAENSSNGTKIYQKTNGENWVAHTNHHLTLDITTLKPGAVSKTVERLTQLKKMLKDQSANLNVDDAKKIFRTKPILKNFITDPGFPTMESIIIKLTPNNPTIYIAPGPPDSNKYSQFDFKHGYVGTE
jgi:hypothetical protein